jgi:uncharacterized protein (DUF1786 family)
MCCSTSSRFRPATNQARVMPTTVANPLGTTDSAETILAIDIGAGTQDILVYDPEQTPENSFRLVMPSQTQIIGQRIRRVTDAGRPLHLVGQVMGGGASTAAIKTHLDAGLPVTATSSAARTIHNDPQRVRHLGVWITDEAPRGAVELELGDLDLDAIETALNAFGVELPERYAIAVQDHGVRIGQGNNDVRGDYLHWLVNSAGDLRRAAFLTPPEEMTRMQAIHLLAPGAIVMDTGAAAVLGALRDPMVAQAAEEGAVLVNLGNMHTFATLVRRDRVLGVFEHHTGGLDRDLLGRLVERLRYGELTNREFRERFDGHGAVVAEDYRSFSPFRFIAVTGPNRSIAAGLNWHQAAPYGDMMLTGAFGLVDGYLAAAGA